MLIARVDVSCVFWATAAGRKKRKRDQPLSPSFTTFAEIAFGVLRAYSPAFQYLACTRRSKEGRQLCLFQGYIAMNNIIVFIFHGM